VSPRSLFALLIIAWFGTACASQVKTAVCSGKTQCTHKGVAYHLPKRYVKLTITRSKVVPAQARAAAAAARTAVETAQKASTDADAVAATKQALADATGDPTARAAAVAAASAAKAEATVAKAALAAAQAKLLAAEEQLRIAESGAEFADAIEIALLPPVPDTSRTFVADLSHNAFVDDDLKIAVGANGLLQSTNATHADRAGDVLVELAKTAAGVAKLMAGGPLGSRSFSAARKGAPESRPFRFEKILDPSIVQSPLALKGGHQLTVTPLGSDGVELSAPPKTAWGRGGSFEGLVYRRQVPYLLELSSTDPAVSVDTQTSVVVLLPNKGPEVLVPLSGRPFTTATHGVTFEDGMLVRRDVLAPSEVLGVASIPPRILEQIVSLPTELIQLKIDTTAREGTLLQNEKLQLDAYKALLDAQKALQAAAATGAP
jgi:hypothetical protein